MRLFLSDKEARLIRTTILVSVASMTKEQQATAHQIIDRMDLCDKLQNNERRSKEDARL